MTLTGREQFAQNIDFLRSEAEKLGYLFEGGWGVGSAPRPQGPDLETVLLIRTMSEKTEVIENTAMMSYPFLVRRLGDGWRIEHVGPEASDLPLPSGLPTFN
jgi:hypothetical protein